MSVLFLLTRRNIKLFFKDKGMFFTSLATPLILLVLYATFLGNVYKDSFMLSIPYGLDVSDELIDSLVGGQLVSSILSVSCVTVAFCSNFLMVQDKATGIIKDLRISPVRSSTLSMSYYLASLLSAMIICLLAAVICLIYLYKTGWYMSGTDVMLLMADVIVLSLFGTALSSIINFFLSTQGQISAVGAIISAGYGFICGAYMPISQFSEGLQKVVMFLPGTYGTSLLRNHALDGSFQQMESDGIPSEVVESMKDSIDYNIYFFDEKVEVPVMYMVLLISIVLCILIYILLNIIRNRRIH